MGKELRLERIRDLWSKGITVVALLLILFGLAEIVAGFTHHFYGISPVNDAASIYSFVTFSAFYA